MRSFRKEWFLALFGFLVAAAAPAAPAARPQAPLAPAAPADAQTIPNSTTTPNIDGSCDSGGLGGPEYGDATNFQFLANDGVTDFPVQVWVKHTVGNVYICMSGLLVPDPSTQTGPNAVVYIDRTGLGGARPNSDTFAVSISYLGGVVRWRGGPTGWDGPAPSSDDLVAARTTVGDVDWRAEFTISHLLLGGADWNTTGQTIGLAVAQQWVSFGGDDYGWPNGYVWDIPNTWGRGNIIAGGAASTLNLLWNSLEVTQGIQDLTNSVGLVARKRTFVRGHVLTNQTRGPVTARLAGSRAGLSLGPPLLPMNLGATIIAYFSPNRGSLTDSFIWELPATWVTPGVISITATLNPYHNPSEALYTDNNRTNSALNFQTVHPLQIRLYDVQYTTPGGTLVTTGLLHQVMLESWLRREYPIGLLRSSRRMVRVAGSTNPLVTNIGTAASWVNGLLDQQRALIAGNDPGWLYVGQVGPAGGFMRGITPGLPAWTTAAPTGGTPFCPSGGACFDNDGSFGDWYGAHEIGHALGRPHVGRLLADIGCGADWYFFQPGYPYETAIIGGPSLNPTRFFGFDAGDANLGLITQVIPNTWTDNMSYCSNEWISDWTYTSIRDYINSAFPAQAATGLAAPAAPALTGNYLFIHGTIVTATQSATIDLISRMTEVGGVTPLQAGGYEVRLFNAGDALLTSYPVSPTQASEGGAGLILSQVVTFTTGTRRVAIFSSAAGHEIASVAVSANAPTVSNVNHSGGFNLPASGPVNVTWTAADSDGPPLTYDLQYSFTGNGGPWRTLAIGLTATSATIDAAELESTASAQSGYFRVVASDGVNTGSGLSDKFSVADKPPLASISSPVSFSQYGFGQTVSLVGLGQDYEDGTLDYPDLCWESSLDGPLGCAATINPAFLSLGIHQVTLTAMDSEGLTGTADVFVQILDDASLLIPTSPQLDVAPAAAMQFLAHAGGANPPAQALTVHDLAGTNLAYTVTVSQPWVTLNALSGNTPGTLSVTVSIAGMPAGTSRTADITVTAAGALASPQVIHLTVQTEGEPPRRLYLPVAMR